MMFYIRRWVGSLLCKSVGHREPNVFVYPDRSLIVFCPRCYRLFFGTPKQESNQ